MSKIIISLALSAATALVLTAAPIPVLADSPSARERPKTQQSGEPAKRPAPIFRNSPTDEYAPRATMPRAAAPRRIGRAARTSRVDTRLSTMFTAPSRAAPTLYTEQTGTLTYSYLPPPPLLAPGSGPPARVPTTRGALYYYDQPASPDFDGAPCPTRSRESLGELFACTLR